jgi:predicted hydrolase (HD superfamily)
MTSSVTRAEALALLRRYNKEPFHILHALTLERVMGWFADALGLGGEKEYWSLVGLLHDIDFELYPDEHCRKAPELLREAGVGEDMVRSVVSHGWGICADVKPEREMEKVLFAADELTGLIGAAVKMRPSKSASDLEVASLRKKFKDKGFAAGCSRDIIRQGAELLGWDLDKLFDLTIRAMRACEDDVAAEMAALGLA